MASSKAYLDFVLEQLAGLDGVTYRAMMGEYLLYYRGKIIGGIYDDRLLVKPVEAAAARMPDARRELPYEGAKAMLLVENMEDRDFLQSLFSAMYEELPELKKMRKKDSRITIRPIEQRDDPAMAEIVRENLRKFHLDIPGTAYYDPQLDSLSWYYSEKRQKRAYFVAEVENGEVVGGIGMELFPGFEACGEVQKLYVSEKAKRQGVGQRLLTCIEQYGAENGIRLLYLETHSNLQAAVCLYEKNGYHRIDRPKDVVHSTMDLFYLKDLEN